MKRTTYTATLTEGNTVLGTATGFARNSARLKAHNVLRDIAHATHESFTINHDGTYTGDRSGRVIRITITHE